MANHGDSRFELSLHSIIGQRKESADNASQSTTFSRQQSRESRTHSQSSNEDAATSTRRTFTPYHSQSVPKSENLQGATAGRGTTSRDITTLMLRNIPNKYAQDTLMAEIDDCGFLGTYDFFYLPMDVHNRSNVGYAFINFVDPRIAQRFIHQFSQHHFQKIHSRKVSSVNPAHVQGLDENLKHFENRAVTHARNDLYRPVVLKNGQPMDFEIAVSEAKARLDAKARRQNPRSKDDGCFSRSGQRMQSAQRMPVPPTPPAQLLQDSSLGLHGARLSLEAAIRDMLTTQYSGTSVGSFEGAYADLTPPPGLPCAGQQQNGDNPAYVNFPAWAAMGKHSADTPFPATAQGGHGAWVY